MPTNVTISPIDGDTVVYDQDGKSYLVESGSTQSFQIIERGFCTISDAGQDESEEHPPQYPPQWFVESMQRFADAMRKAIQDPVATPY